MEIGGLIISKGFHNLHAGIYGKDFWEEPRNQSRVNDCILARKRVYVELRGNRHKVNSTSILTEACPVVPVLSEWVSPIHNNLPVELALVGTVYFNKRGVNKICQVLLTDLFYLLQILIAL